MPLVAALTYLTPNKIRSPKLRIYQIRIHSIRELSYARMEKYMLMVTRMIMPTFII